MVRELIHDPIFLAQPSEAATAEDVQIAKDLLDTLAAHKETCVGMAANMIGQLKRIIVFDNDGTPMLMFNPEIIQKWWDGAREGNSHIQHTSKSFHEFEVI